MRYDDFCNVAWLERHFPEARQTIQINTTSTVRHPLTSATVVQYESQDLISHSGLRLAPQVRHPTQWEFGNHLWRGLEHVQSNVMLSGASQRRR